MLGAHGARGEVVVRPLSRFPERFRTLRHVFLGESYTRATITRQRRHGRNALLTLDAVPAREAAQALTGRYLYVPETDAVPLPAGEYFVHQIVGLNVVTLDGAPLGSVEEVLQTGSNDVYLVRGPRGDVLLPAIKDVIKEVDLARGTMRVELLPGLVD